MDKINSFLPLKPGYAGPPEMNLRATLKEKILEDCTLVWVLSPAKYVKQAVRNVKTYLMKNLDARYALPKRAENPYPCDNALKDSVFLLLLSSMAMYYIS